MKNTFQFLILIIWDKRALRFYYLIRFRFITRFVSGLLPDSVSFYYLIRFRFITLFGSFYYLIRFRFITWFGLVCGGNVTLSLNSSASTQSKTNFESLSKMAALRFKFKMSSLSKFNYNVNFIVSFLKSSCPRLQLWNYDLNVIFIKIKLHCHCNCFIVLV